MGNKSWTNHEERIVREHYPQGGVRPCMELLPHRTEGSIYQFAQRAGIKAPGGWSRPAEPYTTSDWIDAQIRRTYTQEHDRGAVERLARRVERPRHWVSRRAAQLGVRDMRKIPEAWSQEELEILERDVYLHPGTIRKHLAQAGYSRTETAIILQMRRKELYASDNPDLFTARSLSQLMGVEGKTVVGWIERGMLKARRHKPMRETQVGRNYEITRAAVRRFMTQFTAHFDHRKADKWFLVDTLTGVSSPKAETGLKDAAA
jgi:hypothetical protein